MHAAAVGMREGTVTGMASIVAMAMRMVVMVIMSMVMVSVGVRHHEATPKLGGRYSLGKRAKRRGCP